MAMKGKIFSIGAVIALLYITSQFTRGRADPSWNASKVIASDPVDVSPAERTSFRANRPTQRQLPSSALSPEPNVPAAAADLITTESLSNPQKQPAKVSSPTRRSAKRTQPSPNLPPAPLSTKAPEPIQFGLAGR